MVAYYNIYCYKIKHFL